MTTSVSDTGATTGGRPPFGFARIVRDARDLFVRAPMTWLLLALPAAILAGARAALEAAGRPGSALVFLLLGFAATLLALAAMYQLAWSAWSGEPLRTGQAVRVAGRRVLPFLGCALLAILSILIGLVLLIVPGLYLWAIFALLGPVIVLEGKGLDAFERSLALTKDYRWPTVGLFVSTTIAVVVATFILGFILGAAFGIGTGGPPGSPAFVQAVATAGGQIIWLPAWGLVSIACYRRLRDIKAGRADAGADADWPFTGASETDTATSTDTPRIE